MNDTTGKRKREGCDCNDAMLVSTGSIASNLHNTSGIMLTVFGYLDTHSLISVGLVRKAWNWTNMNEIDNVSVNQLWARLANCMVRVPTTTEPGTRRHKRNIMYERPASDKQYINDQLDLKKRLRRGLENGNDKECWCNIWFRAGCNQSIQPLAEIEGMMARITAINGDYFSFSNFSVNSGIDRPETVLVHSNQFAIEWVNIGHNSGGTLMNGTELEHDFRKMNTAFWTGANYADADDWAIDSDHDNNNGDNNDIESDDNNDDDEEA